jgi:predicted 3-demethylubiquinone-9 3-methyltransferase (glyoxalase superfamily)
MADFYISLVPGSAIETVYRPDPDGPAMVVEFTLAGAPMMVMTGNPQPVPSYMTSISVLTADQAETDTLWNRLSADGGEEQMCGWLRDRFGIHWQIVPEALPRLMHSGDAAAAGRVQGALMQMRKIDISALEAAFHAG